MGKEQIIIDGINITGCICCLRICTTTKKPEAICNEYGYCSKVPNCYYKQLARKTQEYEELKERLVRTEEDLKYQCVDCMNVKSDRYRKALEEIEEYIYNNTDFDINDSIQSKTAGYDILQIIKDVQKDD